MTDPTMALMEYLRKQGVELNGDFLREAVGVMLQALMEVQVTQQIGAERYQRTAIRSGQRNGHRRRGWETRVGEIPLDIPKLRQGSYFLSFLEPRRRSEQAPSSSLSTRSDSNETHPFTASENAV